MPYQRDHLSFRGIPFEELCRNCGERWGSHHDVVCPFGVGTTWRGTVPEDEAPVAQETVEDTSE